MHKNIYKLPIQILEGLALIIMVSPLNIIRESPASYTIKGLEMFHHTYHKFALS